MLNAWRFENESNCGFLSLATLYILCLHLTVDQLLVIVFITGEILSLPLTFILWMIDGRNMP